MRKAFTLAEVLITLGIIGVVAVLTIPTFIAEHRKNEIETALKKTYVELNDLVKRSESDNGDFVTWDFSLSEVQFFNKYFKPYFVSVKYCGNDCFYQGRYNSGWFHPINNGKIWAEGSCALPKYRLYDGRELAFQRDNSQYFVNITVDVNGKRGKTRIGEDVFQFYIGKNTKGQCHLGDGNNSGTLLRPEAEILRMCINHYGSTCGHYLEKNGFKFPQDYPLKSIISFKI